MFACKEPIIHSPKVEKGVLDLRSLRIDCHNSTECFEKDEVFNLDGEWEFYWGEFLDPNCSKRHFDSAQCPDDSGNSMLAKRLDSFPEHSAAPQRSSIEFRRREPKYIQVPSQWQKHDYPVDGYATYRLRVLLPDRSSLPVGSSNEPELKSNKNDRRSVSISMTNVGSAYAMYINGTLVSQKGIVGKSKEESEPFMQSQIFSIDEYINTPKEGEKKLSLLSVDKNEIDILVHVSNFHHFRSGIWDNIKLGATNEIDKAAKQKFVLDIILFSSLFVLGFYHLILYFSRKKDSAPLFFGVLCILFALRTISINERMILNAFPMIPFTVVHKIEYFSFYFGAYLLTQFVRSLFPNEFSKKWLLGFSVVFTSLSILPIFFSMSIYETPRLIGQITSLIAVFYIFYILIIATFRKRIGAKLFLTGYSLFALFITNDILKAMGILTTPFIATYGLFVFIFFQSAVLSRRFASGFLQAEKLGEDLEKKSNSLEETTLELSLIMEEIETKISGGVKEQQKFNQCLLDLSKSNMIQSGLNPALQELTEICTQVLNIGRCSIWLFNGSGSEIKCVELFQRNENLHSQGVVLREKDFPEYFQFVKKGLVITAPDIYNHPAMAAFNEVYSKPNGIYSLLGAPIRSGGSLIGIICCEQIEKKKDWTWEEENFVSALAGIVAGYFESDEKRKTFQELIEAKKEIENLNAFAHLVNSLSNLNDIFMEISKYFNYRFGIISTWLFLPDEKKEFVNVYKAYSYNRLSDEKYNYLMNRKIPLRENDGGFVYKIYQRKKPLYLSKIPKFEFEIDKEFVYMLNIKSFFYIPLVRKDECVGILGFSNLEKKMKLSRKEINNITNLCSQIAGVVDTNHFLQQVKKAKQETERAKQKTEETIQLLKKVNETSDLEEIMKIILFYVQENYHLPYYSLFVTNSMEQKLVFSNAVLPDYVSESESKFLSQASFPINSKNKDSIHSRALEERKPFFIPDVEKEIRTEGGKAILTILKHKSLITIPIFLKKSPIGTLDFFSIEAIQLSEEDIVELSLLAEQLAGVIQGSLLYKQVQEEKEKSEIEKGIAIIAQKEAEKSRMEIHKIADAMKMVNASENLLYIVQSMILYLEDEFEFDTTSLLLVEEDANSLFTHSFVGNVPLENISYLKKLKIPLEKESGTLYATYKRMKMLYLTRIPKKLTNLDREIVTMSNGKFILQVPLIIQDKTIGILNLTSTKKVVRLDKSDRAKLQLFADQIAGAVYNSYLSEKTQEAKEQADIEKKIAITAQQEAEVERAKSEKLLLNILPSQVANELKEKGYVQPVFFENATIMFTDFKGFTQIAEGLTPQELIKELDGCFSQFDNIIERNNLEKLKTIGDAYMCAGGLPRVNKTHPIDACLAALEIQSFMNQMKELKQMMEIPYWELRLGIHSGPLMAGVVGEKKFAYDVWGDTVNTASRMESSGTPGKINISYVTYEFVKDYFDCEYRGEIDAKNKGKIKMFYLNRIKKEYAKDENGLVPNAIFWNKFTEI